MRLRILLLCCSVFFCNASLANIFERDDRQSIEPLSQAPELLPIGTLSRLSSEGRGTAFLVSPCYILTNLHVAVSDLSNISLEEESYFELLNGDGSRARIEAAGDWGNFKDFENEEDWALLKLESCLGKKVGWLSLLPSALEPLLFFENPLELAGFPGDRFTDKISLDPNCRMRDLQWRHDCATRGGNSGSPMFFKRTGPIERPQDLRVVALTASAIGSFAEIIREYDVYFSNGAVPVSAFYSRIERFLRQDLKKDISSDDPPSASVFRGSKGHNP